MQKKILNKDAIQNKMMMGMDRLADIVKRTLGPGGLPIVIQRQGQALDGSPISPRVTKDGVSVAQECFDPDPEVDVFMQSVKNICRKTNSDAGDGTTTAIVLGQALVHEMQEYLEKTGDNPQLIKESLEEASKKLIEELVGKATPINMDVIEDVATISANGDRKIGEAIREAFEHVGAEGVVTVDEGSGTEVTVTKVDGYQFNRGAEQRDAFFNSDSRTHFEAQTDEDDEDVAVILYDGKLMSHVDLIPALNIIGGVENGRATKKFPPMVIIANEFSRDVIQFMLIQQKDNGLVFCPVRSPHMTNVRTGYLEDLAFYTGGTRLGNGNRTLSAIVEDDIGYVEKAVVTNRTTTLYGGMGHEDGILERVDQLKAQKEAAPSPYDAQVIGDRLASLTNGIAKIGVGGHTEMEVKEKYDRIEDALNASRAAIEEGVIPGGGTELFVMGALLEVTEGKENPTVGEEILYKSIQAPFLQILENVGLSEEEKDEVIQHVIQISEVYDSRNKEFVNAYDSGILDPVKVTRCALENAVSIAGLLATAGGAIIYTPDN